MGRSDKLGSVASKRAIIVALATVTAPIGAHAQVIDEIVVTAQKREQNLQDTALAISAFTGESLNERGITDILALESSIPNLHVGQEQDGFKIAIRGIGLQGTSAISDPGVAFYLDDFYVPRPTGGSATFFDVSRVEVLRGPQGTLYGRNATGGVVNVIANAPAPEFSGQVGVSAGERNLRELRGFINVPFSDNIQSRFTAVYGREDGYTENLSRADGAENLFGRDGDLSLRGQVLFTNNDDLDILASVTYTDLNGSGVPLRYLERNFGGPRPTQALLGTIPPESDDPLEIRTNEQAFNDTETTLAFVRVEKSFGGVDLFVQGGALEQNANSLQDVDGSEVDVSNFLKVQENQAESLEIRLSSDDIDRLSWIVGAYYFQEETDLSRRVELNGLTPGGFISLPDFFLTEFGESETAAGFGSATYEVTDQLAFTAGIRYTDDTRGGTRRTLSNFGGPLPPDLEDVQVDYSRVTWKAGLEYRPAISTLAYASVSNGYKAGGFNLTSSGVPYEPEDVIAFEGGVKASPLGDNSLLTVDAFYYDYSDLQLSNLTTVNNAPGQLVTNAASTTVYGVEIAGQVEVYEGLILTAGFNWIDTEFEEYFNTDPRFRGEFVNPDDPLGLNRQNLAGNQLPYVAEYEAALGFRYTAQLAGLDLLTIAADTNWHDDFFLREYNDPDIDLVKSNTQTDASVTYEFVDEGFQITAYVTNIENNVEKNNIQISPGFVGQSALASYTKPRTIGVRADYSF